MAAVISSTFEIVVTETLNNSSVTVTNPGRSFRIAQVLASGANASSLTVRKNTVAGAVAAGPTALATGDLNDFPIAVSATVADTIFTATDNIFLIETASANITRVTLICIAADAEALTVA